MRSDSQSKIQKQIIDSFLENPNTKTESIKKFITAVEKEKKTNRVLFDSSQLLSNQFHEYNIVIPYRFAMCTI